MVITGTQETSIRIELKLEDLIPNELGSRLSCMGSKQLPVAGPGHVHHRWMADSVNTPANNSTKKQKKKQKLKARRENRKQTPEQKKLFIANLTESHMTEEQS